MIGGLMVVLIGLVLTVLAPRNEMRRRPLRAVVGGVCLGTGLYYAAGISFAAVEAHGVAGGRTFASALGSTEPWQALVLVPAALAVLAGFTAYARAVWPLTARQRQEGRSTLKAVPAVYTGRIPRRVRRRSPAALAGYELPMGLLGFPGVGWLFAGFPFTASILLLAGPALTWAVIPAAFSPYGQGPLRGIGWKLELAWLPTMALVSSAALFAAHARRRARETGRPPRRRRRRSYRTRVSVAAGGLLLVLVTIPFVPAVAGVGSSAVRYSYETRFTPQITGQFLSTPRGAVKLFAWRDPQASYPRDALSVRASEALGLVVRAAAVDDSSAYQLFDVDRGTRVDLAIRRSSPTQLDLGPRRPLSPGRYAFVATHEGMFGGKDFAYLTIVPTGAATSPISADRRTAVPAVAKAFPPVAAALVALLFAVLLAGSFLRRPKGSKALWAAGFAAFAVAAASEAAAQRIGWNGGLYRTYYLAGGVLTVAYLGAGSAWLLLPRRARDVLLGALVAATVAAATAVLLAPVDGAGLAATPSGRPPANGVLGGHAYLWAIALNSVGTAFLIGGSLYSILRRRRIRSNVWIAAGALVLALTTGLSRAGDYSLVYVGELVGIALMFAGFKLVGASRPARGAVRPETPIDAKAALAR
jgi:hypothetical protein